MKPDYKEYITNIKFKNEGDEYSEVFMVKVNQYDKIHRPNCKDDEQVIREWITDNFGSTVQEYDIFAVGESVDIVTLNPETL